MRRKTKHDNGKAEIVLAFADQEGRVFDYPGMEPAFRTGRRFVRVDRDELIPLPNGSLLFSLPDRVPVRFDGGTDTFSPVAADPEGRRIQGVSSFLASGYLRTYLPAFEKRPSAVLLPLWAYSGVVVSGEDFLVPALRVDEDPRSDPALHENDRQLAAATKKVRALYPGNRLVDQLALCSTEYRCLCARNFFLGRYEAPVPTSPACNCACAGCLSRQDPGSPFPASQPRLGFTPSVDEIAAVILHHVTAVERSVASFGQGCEGEPLLRGADLAEAVSRVRGVTDRGTIHVNTNGSLPDMVEKLIGAGIDSIRFSLNSPTERYYERYYRPRDYSFDDVKRSLDRALNAGIFVSLNLFFLPGFTDMETEAEALFRFLERYPVNMIQTRNLNIDPDFYLDMIGFEESEPLGIRTLLGMLRAKRPGLVLGYYNPPKERFSKAGAD